MQVLAFASSSLLVSVYVAKASFATRSKRNRISNNARQQVKKEQRQCEGTGNVQQTKLIHWIYNYYSWPSVRSPTNLLVQGLGEGGGGSDVSVTGSLVGTSGLLEGLSVQKVSSAVGLVRSGVVGLEIDIEESGEHLDVGREAYFVQE